VELTSTLQKIAPILEELDLEDRWGDPLTGVEQALVHIVWIKNDECDLDSYLNR
jgi:hypothetical protein